jgi:hypothetical protein
MTTSRAPGPAHAVFFTLKDRSPAALESLIAACNEYLTGHAGTVYVSVGTRAEQYARPVNDAEFDVALLVVFAAAAAHDRYQTAPRHQQFIAQQSPNWAAVRVFDAAV